MPKESEIEIQEIHHHRNGVFGTGFYIVKFKSEEDSMVAMVFPDPGNCAVFNFDLLAAKELRFGINSFRGDLYEHILRAAIQKHKNK